MNLKKLFCFLLAALIALPVFATDTSRKNDHRYKVAACDWMMLKRQKLGAFKLLRELGGDGLEMDMGGFGKRDTFDNKLRQPNFRKIFRETADSLGVEVPSVAMSGFFGQSFIGKPTYSELIDDCLSTMEVMGAKTAFLPLGGISEDWTVKGPARKELVSRLHKAGEKAIAKGMTIGIRIPLSAKEAKKLLKEIDSKGVKVYFNLQDALDNGRNPSKELRELGKDNICQIHLSNTDGFVLSEDPAVNLKEIKETLDKMGWSGWLVVERSRDKEHVRDVKRNFGNNIRYIKKVFQAE